MVLKKHVIDRDVYSLAIERINYLYDHYDHVCVSFSGGKDSTVCLNLTLEVARSRGKLPLDCIFWDEEAIHPETIEYMERVSKLPDVRLRWYCLPIQHRNACSRKQPYWYPWAPEDRAKWCRPLPDQAITEVQGFSRKTIPELNHLLFNPSLGRVAIVVGLRAQESLRRFMVVSTREHENWISLDPMPRPKYISLTKPIYDWTTDDVWTAPQKFGWDYNRAYDVMSAAGISKHEQRVCPPYGEEPLLGLYKYATCWPHLWEKMIGRVPGAATAARYSRTVLYSFGKMPESIPGGYNTWQEAIDNEILKWPIGIQAKIRLSIKNLMNQHFEKIMEPIPTFTAHPLTGICWKSIFMIANRGDLKGRRAGSLSSRRDKNYVRTKKR